VSDAEGDEVGGDVNRVILVPLPILAAFAAWRARRWARDRPCLARIAIPRLPAPRT